MGTKKLITTLIFILTCLFSKAIAQDLLSCKDPQIMKSDKDCKKTGEIDVRSFNYQGKKIVYTGIECVKIREAIALLENVEIEKIKITSTNKDPFLESNLDIIANSLEKKPHNCEQKILRKLIEMFDIKYVIIYP